MRQSHIIRFKPLLVSVAISVAVGALAGFLSKDNMAFYQSLNRPPLSPPAIVFPIVWTILYVLMGISAYLIWVSDSPRKSRALRIYSAQLAVNFIWPILFFNLQALLFSFFWLLLLWVLIIFMIYEFYQIRPAAAWLQIPYLLWVTFAGYLNYATWLLNR